MKTTLTRITLWLAFCFLTAVSVYSFFSGRLLAQEIWMQKGKERLILFAALYTGWFVAVSLWRRSLFLTLTLVVAVAYTIASVGFGPLLAAAFFLYSSLVAGKSLRSLLSRNEELGTPADSGIDDILGLLLGVSVYIWIIGLVVHFRVNYPVTYLILLSVPIVWNRRLAVSCFHRCASLFRPVSLEGKLAHVLLGITVFVFLAHWLVTLKPEISGDGLAMHLAILTSVANFHRWAFEVRHLVWAVMPMGGDWCFTAPYMLGGEFAARLLNFSLFALLAALLWCVVRRWLSQAPALLTVALFATTPIVQFVTGSLFVENIWALMLFGAVVALWRYREHGRRADLYLMAALLGTALGTKLGALSFIAAISVPAALALSRLWRRGKSTVLVTGVIVVAVLLLAAAQPYVTAYVKSGNPLFPFMNGVFKSKYFDSAASFVDPRFTTPLGPLTLYDVTFRTSKYMECQNGAAGFHYLLLLPLSLLLFRRDWPYVAKVALWVSVVSFFLTFRIQSNLRYVYPALAMVMVPIAVLLDRLRSADVRLYKAVFGTSLAVVFVNLYFLPSSGWYHKEFYLNTLFNPSQVEEYIKFSAPVRKLVEYVNVKIPGQPVGFVETNHIAGLRAKAFTNTWHNDAYIWRLRAATSAVECLKLMNELGITYFIAPTMDSGITITEVPLQSFLLDFTEPEYRFGNYHVTRLKEEYRGEDAWKSPVLVERGLVPAPPDSYDDGSQFISYMGAWVRDNQFSQPTNGTLTYSNVVGDSFRFAFHGSEVTWVYTKAFNRGVASVMIDGVDKGEIDLYSAATSWRARTTFADLGAGNHIMVARILPKKNPSSNNTFVDLDCLEVR